jgi:hypothetical protein
MTNAKELFRILFSIRKFPVVRRIKVGGANTPPHNQLPKKKPTLTQYRLAGLLSWIMGAALIASIIGGGILAGIGKEVPEFISTTIATILGYFGGAVAVIFDIRARNGE